MFLRVLDIEAHRVFRHPMQWMQFMALLGLLGMYCAARAMLTVASFRSGVAAPTGPDVQGGLELFRVVGILFYAASAALVFGYDLPDRSVQVWLARGITRPIVVMARLVVALFLAVLVVAVAVLGLIAEAALARTAFLAGHPALPVDWVQVVPAIVRLFVAAIPYVALTATLAIAGRSALFAAAGALVFRTLAESLLLRAGQQFLPALPGLLPSQLAAVLEHGAIRMDPGAMASPLGPQFLGEPMAVLCITVWLIIFGGSAVIIFAHQDWGG